MVKIKPFAVERWMDEHETAAKYNIAETCCASINLQNLKSLSNNQSIELISTLDPLTYGAIPGSQNLRNNVAKLYSGSETYDLSAEEVLITPGAIAANYLVLYSLIGPGDHVICHWPTYQQLYSVPESLGAMVDLWRASEDKDWLPDIEELKQLIRPNTKLIIINNPNNPTGATLPISLLEAVVSLARAHNITILSLNYPNTIATGSLSKAFSLAGIRVGWIASRSPSILSDSAEARHYTNIAVSSIDDQIATHALGPSVIHNLLARNLQLARTNLAILEEFILEHPENCKWVKPTAGTTAFISFQREGQAVDDVIFCDTLQKSVGVMFVPGSTCFGDGHSFKGFVRIGYACETNVLVEGLEKLDEFLKSGYGDIPLVS